MKTAEPLQGFIMSTSHETIHLALLIAMLSCFQYFKDYSCHEEDGSLVLILVVHGWCFVSSIICMVLDHFKLWELS